MNKIFLRVILGSLCIAISGQLCASIQITGFDLVDAGGIDANVTYYYSGNRVFIEADWIDVAPATFEITFDVVSDTSHPEALNASASFATFEAANVNTLLTVDPFRAFQESVAADGVGTSFDGVTWETETSAGLAAITNGVFSAVFGDVTDGEVVNVTGSIQLSGMNGHRLADPADSGGVVDLNLSPSVVPEPAAIAVWSLLGLVGFVYGWRQQRKTA